jgi:transposase
VRAHGYDIVLKLDATIGLAKRDAAAAEAAKLTTQDRRFLEPPLQLDDHLKNLLRELGHAINDTVSDSDRITGAIAGVRAHGYDIVLKLDATIGLAKRDAAAAEAAKLTTQDRRFLESLRIQVDQESFDQMPDKKPAARLTMTPQDVRFLKSLRIATDDIE